MLERVKSFLGLTKKPDGLDARKQDERIYAYFCRAKEDEGVCAIIDRLEVYERGSLSDKTKDIVIIYHHAGSQSPKTVHFAMEKARVSQLSHLVGKVYPLNDDIRRYIGTLPRDQNIDITGHPSLGDYILAHATKR